MGLKAFPKLEEPSAATLKEGIQRYYAFAILDGAFGSVYKQKIRLFYPWVN